MYKRQALISLGYVTEKSLIKALEIQLGVPHVVLTGLNINPEVIALVPQAIAERYSILPIDKNGKKLTIAMVDPTNFYAIDDVRTISGLDIVPAIATEKDILRAINEFYGVQALVNKASSIIKPEDVASISEVQTANDAPVISIVNTIISQAIKERASDIHIAVSYTHLDVYKRQIQM